LNVGCEQLPITVGLRILPRNLQQALKNRRKDGRIKEMGAKNWGFSRSFMNI